MPTIAEARPTLPEELNDRAQDNWELLLAIADAAGGHWPQKARQAALALSGEKEEPALEHPEMSFHMSRFRGADVRFDPKRTFTISASLALLEPMLSKKGLRNGLNDDSC
jgi:Protein of unknown function (DUF3631)